MLPSKWARYKRQRHIIKADDLNAMATGTALAFLLLYFGVTVYNVFSAVPASFTDGVRWATFIVVGVIILITECRRGKKE